jgi:uncharacterized protein YndB with AHSA1/START domain
MTDASWLHEFSTPIAAPRAAVWAALTEPHQLERWCAEHVKVGQEPGEPWQLWGRHSLGAPVNPEPSDRLLEQQAPQLLRYSWLLEGCPTEVTIELQEEGDAGTRVSVRHRLSRPLPHPRPAELIDDYWRLALGNLGAHLVGDGGVVRPDFSDPRPEIRLSIQIDAPPEAVFSALMDPEALRQWVGATAPVVEPRVGGTYSYGWSYPINGKEVTGGPLTILELEPNRLLVTDWPDWRGDASMPMQRIEWHLEPEGKGTRVTVIHAGFTRAADLSDYPFGWAHFAAALKAWVEGATSAG